MINATGWAKKTAHISIHRIEATVQDKNEVVSPKYA